jgi:hypothetical protein
MSSIKKEKINTVNIYINMLSLPIVICMVLLFINSIQINNNTISAIIIALFILYQCAKGTANESNILGWR